jgi:hypothetical protein
LGRIFGRCFQQLTIIGHFDLPHIFIQTHKQFQFFWGQGTSELVTTLLEAENSLSADAEEAVTHRYFLAISPRSGRTGSCVFHQASTSTLLDGRFGSLK